MIRLTHISKFDQCNVTQHLTVTSGDNLVAWRQLLLDKKPGQDSAKLDL
jgi:hypothetical protein